MIVATGAVQVLLLEQSPIGVRIPQLSRAGNDPDFAVSIRALLEANAGWLGKTEAVGNHRRRGQDAIDTRG